MLHETGVDGASAARGAIGNPWFFRQARDIASSRTPFQPSLADQRELLSRHFELTREIYGPRVGVKKMRNFGIHYARLHPHPAQARRAAALVTTEKAWRDFLGSHYPDFRG